MSVELQTESITKSISLSSKDLQLITSIDSLSKVNLDVLKPYLSNKNICNDFISEIEPFILEINKDIKLIISESKRVIPNVRLVFTGVLLDQSDSDNVLLKKIVVKLYIDDNKYSKQFDELSTSYNNLLKAGLKTPKVYFAQKNESNNIAYVIYEYIDTDLDCNDNSKFKLIIDAIAKLHNSNFIQEDLHLDNFIINNKEVYYLDSDSISFCSDKNTVKKKFENFALFLAQLPIIQHDKWIEYIDYYFNNLLNKNIVNHLDDKQTIINYTLRNYRNRVKSYAKKCLRESSEFKAVAKQLTGITRRKLSKVNDSLINHFTANPKKFIEKTRLKEIKKGSSAIVYLIDYLDKQYIIKKYINPTSNLSKLISSAKNLVLKPRAINAWINYNVLYHVGINQEPPLAMLFDKNSLLPDNYYLITEYDKNFARLDVIMGTESSIDKKDYIDTIKNILHCFNKLNIVHNDFKDVNIGFVNNNALVFDLDAMQILMSNILFYFKRDKDLARLLKCYKDRHDIVELLTIND